MVSWAGPSLGHAAEPIFQEIPSRGITGEVPIREDSESGADRGLVIEQFTRVRPHAWSVRPHLTASRCRSKQGYQLEWLPWASFYSSGFLRLINKLFDSWIVERRIQKI